MPTTAPLRLLLLGATGAVGSQVLREALSDPRVSHIVAPTRRPLDAHARLTNPVIDLQQPDPAASWWACDAVICALGTTIRLAGTQAAFAAIDRDVPIDIARLCKDAGATRFALNSSLGASLKGNFYLRTKAQAEDGIKALCYDSTTIVRPSLIDAKREQSRPGERIGLAVAHLFRPLIPGRYRAVKAEDIAHCLLNQVLLGRKGVHIIESENILKA